MSKRKPVNSPFKAINQLSIKDKNALLDCLNDKDKLNLLVALSHILEHKKILLHTIMFDKGNSEHMKAYEILTDYINDSSLSPSDVNDILIQSINDFADEESYQNDLKDLIRESINELVEQHKVSPDEINKAKETVKQQSEEEALNDEIDRILVNLGY